MKSFVNLEDGSNLSQISPILTCINTLNESSILWDDDRSKHFKSISLEKFKNEIKISKEDGFCFAVSLRDGSCIYTSDAVSYHLGYPKDMLVGQCIMNFLFHKDHITFANHLTQGLNACFIQGKRDDSHLVLNTFFCRLRLYQGLKQGYSVSDRNTEYKPFKIILHINELIVDDMCVEKPSGTLCVKATATHVASAYSVPEEIPAMTSFSTRHTASCHFSHVDASAIPYLGYLPQDMIGYSVFDFYHVDDLPQLKDIYELVIKEHGSSFRSKPYRFKAQNGCYIMLETEWSCFINPWSHKLEFVVGQHRVLKGPSEIDIFTPSQIYDIILPDEILKECQNIQREIKSLLSESIQTFEAKKTKRFCNKRKRDLAAFVYNCIDDLKGNKQKGNDFPLDVLEDKNNSDPDSVVMGDISPYREANDSSVTSETPPSVQQLRYQENIERFFASQPKTYSDGSNEYNKNEKLLSVEDSQGSSSGSRNGSGSGNDSNSKGVQSQNDNNNQKSGSNSSKCNMSSFTTGDSGYGKSVEKETNDPSVSQTGSSNQIWTNNSPKDSVTNNMEKFSSCLALTEESLCVHNRMNHKHFKQQRKSKPGVATVPLKENWFQKDTTLPKHKKHVHTQTLTLSAPNQKEDALKATATEQPALDFQPSSELKGTAPNLNDSAVPSAYASNPFMFPNNWSPSPTPFFIPVMYMGGMTFFPPATNAQPQWPFGPVPPPTTTSVSSTPKEGNAGCFQIPSFSPQSFQKFNLGESFNQTSTPSKGHTSGISTTLSTTTATSSVETVPSHKHTMTESPNYAGRIGILTSKDTNLKPDPDECQMQVSQSSSFTNSSSCRSADKDEDMELESKRCCASTHSDKIELTSELAYRYQMNVLNLDDVLKKDMEVLKSMPQPELVNQQLQMLQDEREAENESKLKVDEDDFCMTEDVMLGLATEDDVNEELEYREESLLQLMCEDS